MQDAQPKSTYGSSGEKGRTGVGVGHLYIAITDVKRADANENGYNTRNGETMWCT